MTELEKQLREALMHAMNELALYRHELTRHDVPKITAHELDIKVIKALAACKKVAVFSHYGHASRGVSSTPDVQVHWSDWQ